MTMRLRFCGSLQAQTRGSRLDTYKLTRFSFTKDKQWTLCVFFKTKIQADSAGIPNMGLVYLVF